MPQRCRHTRAHSAIVRNGFRLQLPFGKFSKPAVKKIVKFHAGISQQAAFYVFFKFIRLALHVFFKLATAQFRRGRIGHAAGDVFPVNAIPGGNTDQIRGGAVFFSPFRDLSHKNLLLARSYKIYK